MEELEEEKDDEDDDDGDDDDVEEGGGGTFSLGKTRSRECAADWVKCLCVST